LGLERQHPRSVRWGRPRLVERTAAEFIPCLRAFRGVNQRSVPEPSYTATGTQLGPLQDLPPLGRTATWTGINIFRIECGRIVEVWSEVDALSRNQQLTGAKK